MKNSINLSPFKIHWIVLVPDFGIATKADERRLWSYNPFSRQFNNALFSRSFNNTVLATHYPTKERAVEVLNKLIDDDIILSKDYTAYIISDRQFGKYSGDLSSLLTQKQKDDAIKLMRKIAE